MPDVIKQIGLEPHLLAQSVIASWAVVVGPQLSARSQAQRLSKRILWVITESSAWSQELSMRREDLRERINDAVGRQAVEDIRFTVRQLAEKADVATPEEPGWIPFRPKQNRDSDDIGEALERLGAAVRKDV